MERGDPTASGAARFSVRSEIVPRLEENIPKAQRIMIIRHAEKPYVEVKEKTTAPRWTAAKAKNRWRSAAGNAPEQSASCWAPPNLHKGAGFQYFNISTHPILKTRSSRQ